MKVSEVDPNAPPPGEPGALPALPPGPPKLDANGFPQLPGPGMVMMISPGQNGQLTAHMVARSRSMKDLADILDMELNKPVVDKTGLTGLYDFNLEYTPDLAARGLVLVPPPPGAVGPGGVGGAPSDAAAEPGSNLASAVQQLGLRLNSSKAMLDVLVIDKAEKTPSQN